MYGLNGSVTTGEGIASNNWLGMSQLQVRVDLLISIGSGSEPGPDQDNCPTISHKIAQHILGLQSFTQIALLWRKFLQSSQQKYPHLSQGSL